MVGQFVIQEYASKLQRQSQVIALNIFSGADLIKDGELDTATRNRVSIRRAHIPIDRSKCPCHVFETRSKLCGARGTFRSISPILIDGHVRERG
jgi:hypothetical protein